MRRTKIIVCVALALGTAMIGMLYAAGEVRRPRPTVEHSTRTVFFADSAAQDQFANIAAYARWPEELEKVEVPGLAAEVARVVQKAFVAPPSREFIVQNLVCIDHSVFNRRGPNQDVVFLRWSESDNDIMFVWGGGLTGRMYVFISPSGEKVAPKAPLKTMSVLRNMKLIQQGPVMAYDISAGWFYSRQFGSLPALAVPGDGWFAQIARDFQRSERTTKPAGAD